MQLLEKRIKAALIASCFWSQCTEEQKNDSAPVILHYNILFVFQLTSSGAPFWSGPKRCPHPLEFSTSNVSIFYLFIFVCMGA